MATSAFGKAFSAARSSGKKTFTYGGKSYSTATKEETSRKAADKAGPPPKRPAKDYSRGAEMRATTPDYSRGAAMKSNSPKDNLPKGETTMSDPNRRSAASGSGWGDKWRAASGMKKGGKVKKAKK